MSSSRGTRVYVGNLTDKVKKEDLEGEFTKYGKLNSIWVAFNPPGFAFVEFEKRDEAEKACVQERENMKKERQNLFSDRKRQQLEVRKLELKMNYIREFEVWEKSKKDLKNFICTKTKPHIYFRPKVMSEKTEKRLAECQADLERELDAKRNKMNEEIQAIENRFKVLTDRINQSSEGPIVGETATKHDRHDDEEDDDDSMYGGHSDDEQVDRVPSKVVERPQQSRDQRDRHQRESAATDKLDGESFFLC